METRAYDIRAGEQPLELSGVAVVFNQPAKIGGVSEVISPDALRDVDLSDIVLITNHDGAGIPLARSPKTLSLTVTETGLSMQATLPETEQGRAVYEAVRRGDLSQMSFAFDIANSDFNEETQTRTITRISKIYEISIVNFAAYKQTTVQARKEENTMYNPVTASLDAQTQTRDAHATAEYRTAFFKNLLGQPLTDAETRAMTQARAEKRADAFNTLTSSAAVVPEQTLNQIFAGDRPAAGLINEIRKFNVPSNLSVPVGVPTDPAAWHVEGATVDRKNISTTSVSFAGYELIKILSMSAAVKRMSLSAFENYLSQELRQSITEAIGAAIVSGTGNGQPTGILSGVTWNAANSKTVTGLKSDDLLSLIALLPAAYASGAKFSMSTATLFGSVYPLQTTNGDFIFTDAVNGGGRRLFGFEIILDDNITPGVILFGNFNYYGVNFPEGILIETSRESGFTSGLIDYRALTICDAKPIIPAAFVKLSIGAA